MIRRRGQTPEEESSSEEEDAFSALARKRANKRSKLGPSDTAIKSNSPPRKEEKQTPSQQNNPAVSLKLPVSLTSSMKRHHKTNDSRKAKMDALLQELSAEQKSTPKERQKFVPEKKGSYVDPAEEHLTTNIFVGNLAPSITEEDLTGLFEQFGPLYSIKVMWPRNKAEINRKRKTGFVCFMNREDAEEAMESCNETDPFNVGRLIIMRWGKNVKKGTAAAKVNIGKNTGPVIPHEEDQFEITLPEEANPPQRFDGPPQVIQFGTHSEPKEENEKIKQKELMTGRQIELARGGRRKGNRSERAEGRANMTKQDLQDFDLLVRKKLSVSRDSICEAMAFCFEKSASAREIASLLKECLVSEAPFLSVDKKIARLYLLSDILFNSQQPGVKNAFAYRDAIEKMAAEVFTSLGRKESNDGSIGRMTMNKLRMAVSKVLGAWTEWSVYNPTFLDELEARFEGREIKQEKVEEVDEKEEEKIEKPPEPVEIIFKAPRGGWTEVSENDKGGRSDKKESSLLGEKDTGVISQEEPSKDGNHSDDKDFDKVENVDGDAIDDEDVDDDPFVQEDVDGEELDGEDLDGEDLDSEDLDGEPMDEEDIDGEDIDGEDIDGEDIDGEELI